MKRAIFILTLGLCLLLSDGAHAQRALPAMRGLEIRGGMTDGFYTRDSRSETGYWFGLAMSHYAKNADKWVFGAEFLNRYYPYKSERIPVAQFTAEGGYYYKFLAVQDFFLLPRRLGAGRLRECEPGREAAL